MLSTRFTSIVGCSLPLQQAGMAGTSTAPLVLAVSEAGGLGMFGATGLSPQQLESVLRGINGHTNKPFGVNFLAPFLDPSAVKVAARHARVVEFFYGEPARDLIEMVHDCGALACWQVGSCREAVAARTAGCDLVAAQGVEAGGHVRGTVGLLPLLSDILPVIDVPVIAAGGIGSGSAMAAALTAGAAAVRVGTRFVAAAEADAHPEYVAALIRARSEDTVLTTTFSVGWPDAPHRVLRACVDAAVAYGGEFVGEHVDSSGRWPIPRLASTSITKAKRGAIAAMPHWAGQSVGSVRAIQPAAEIIAEMIAEATACLVGN